MNWSLSFAARVSQRRLAIANAAAVGSLYLNQALLGSASAHLPASVWLALIPFATLAGYAAGVALIAFGPSRRRLSVSGHLGFLAAALLAAAVAPDAPSLVFASVCVGLGAAVAQRVLAAAADLAGPAAAGQAIGRVIACGLLAALLVKLSGAGLAAFAGWRTVFVAVAACVAMAGLVLRSPHCARAVLLPGITALDLWRSSALLRRVALQQAALFAAFQAAWLLALTALPADERCFVVVGGGCAGLLAALRAGRLSDRADRGRVALGGSAMMALAAAVILPAAYGTASGLVRVALLLAGMACIDGGLQVALVANQARAQAIRPDLRSRCAALLTMTGSLGGGAGAGSAYWLSTQFGAGTALALVAALAGMGLACSLLPAHRVRRPHAVTNPPERQIILGTTSTL